MRPGEDWRVPGRGMRRIREHVACPECRGWQDVGMNEGPPVVSRQALDPEMLVSAIRHADLEPCQLSARPVMSTITRVLCRRICLDLVSVGPAMLYRGAMPKDCYTLSFVLENPGVTRSFNFGIEFSGGGYMGFFPPGGALESTNPGGGCDAILTVPSEVFLAAVEQHFPDMPDGVLARGAGVRVGPVEQRRLRGLLDGIGKVIGGGGDDPGRECVCRQLECELLMSFLAALRDGCGRRVNGVTCRVAGRHRRFRQVRDFVEGHSHQALHLEDFCRVSGLSAGGTENLFRDFLGIGPITFLRHQRLHRARRALLREAPVHGAVKKAALGAGFRHMGRFSSEYRQLFGEGPAETLAMG